MISHSHKTHIRTRRGLAVTTIFSKCPVTNYFFFVHNKNPVDPVVIQLTVWFHVIGEYSDKKRNHNAIPNIQPEEKGYKKWKTKCKRHGQMKINKKTKLKEQGCLKRKLVKQGWDVTAEGCSPYPPPLHTFVCTSSTLSHCYMVFTCLLLTTCFWFISFVWITLFLLCAYIHSVFYFYNQKLWDDLAS